jgi:hypothetical protein
MMDTCHRPAMATATAAGGLKGNDMVGRQQGPLLALVSGLGTAPVV